MEELITKLQGLLAEYGFRAVGALVILLLGWWVAKMLSNLVRRLLTKSKMDNAIVSFLSNLTYVVLMIFVFLAVLNNLGVATTSFIAVIGAAGLAVGLALSGALANFAAGVLLLIFRPFKVDDFIEGAGTTTGVCSRASLLPRTISAMRDRLAQPGTSPCLAQNPWACSRKASA